MAKLLVVEDNSDYRELLFNFLDSAGYEVVSVQDGREALLAAGREAFDLIILDVMLPKIDGYEVCQKIRAVSSVPVIMLTALGSEEHQLKGYQLQIDGYITKPVSMQLLLEQVAAVLRRTMQQADEIDEIDEMLRFADLSMDVKNHTVTAAGKTVEFTLREFEILKELMAHPGQVISRKSLVAKLWGYSSPEEDETRIVDTHMKNIRKKLAGCNYIETVRGVGYKLQNVRI